MDIHCCGSILLMERDTTFRDKPGSRNIARAGSLQAVRSILERVQPEAVVEVGTGIGAMAHTILANSSAYLYTYEDHEWCQQEAQKNLSAFTGRFEILTSDQPGPKVDVIFIDGGGGGEHDNVGMPALNYNTKVVYIDGRRLIQRQLVRNELRKRGLGFREVRHKDVLIEDRWEKGGIEFRDIRRHPLALIYYLYWTARAHAAVCYMWLRRTLRSIFR